jgi:ElaB/YqjD/DUF883 family membrane-anchored ribosome-binding protein
MNVETPNGNAEAAMRASAESLNQLAERVQDTVRQTQARLGELQREVMHRSKAAAHTTDAYVHEKPWSAALAACAAGFVIGLILGRR